MFLIKILSQIFDFGWVHNLAQYSKAFIHLFFKSRIFLSRNLRAKSNSWNWKYSGWGVRGWRLFPSPALLGPPPPPPFQELHLKCSLAADPSWISMATWGTVGKIPHLLQVSAQMSSFGKIYPVPPFYPTEKLQPVVNPTLVLLILLAWFCIKCISDTNIQYVLLIIFFFLKKNMLSEHKLHTGSIFIFCTSMCFTHL